MLNIKKKEKNSIAERILSECGRLSFHVLGLQPKSRDEQAKSCPLHEPTGGRQFNYTQFDGRAICL